MVKLIEADSIDDFANARMMFREYARWLDIDLSFQHFEQELRSVESMYTPPTGCLLLAKDTNDVCGCVALRALEESGVCEMKRLYVAQTHRHLGLGRKLSEHIISRAKTLGYSNMRLDPLPRMVSAQSLYRKLGFLEIEPYYDSPLVDTVFLELSLQRG